MKLPTNKKILVIFLLAIFSFFVLNQSLYSKAELIEGFDPKIGDFVEYSFNKPQIFEIDDSRNVTSISTIVSDDSDCSFRWEILNINNNKYLIKSDVSIEGYYTDSKEFYYQNGIAETINGTVLGYVNLWISDTSKVKAGPLNSVIYPSQKDDSDYIFKGSLRNTFYFFTYNYLLPGERSSATFTSWQFLDNTGILVICGSKLPLFYTLGFDYLISGTQLRMTDTNIDIGRGDQLGAILFSILMSPGGFLLIIGFLIFITLSTILIIRNRRLDREKAMKKKTKRKRSNRVYRKK